MGVNGLKKYVEDCGLYQVVDMQAVSNDYRSRYYSEPVIAVDGSQCAWYLYGNMDSLHGGQYKEFRESCERFVKRFHDMGINLSFFFDGVPVQEKMSTWVKRREDKAKQISNFFAKLRAAQSSGDDDIGCSFLPEAVVPCAIVTLKQIGCDVRLSTGDCDTEVAQFAARNSCCMGVLSNDSDFLIYCGIPCVFTFSSLDLNHKVTAWRFRSTEIASHLGIQVDDLPALASFVGNDVVRKEAVKELHIKLREMSGPKPVIELVAELLQRSPQGDLMSMCDVAVGRKWREGLELFELVKKSVCSYRFPPYPYLVIQGWTRWDNVLGHVEAKYVSCDIPGNVFTVMKCRIMRCGDVLEDLSVNHRDSPPTGLLVRGMRARMYTVLLWDSGMGPFQVTEYVLAELGEVRQEVVEVQKGLPQGMYHPGLIQLWSGPEYHRWRIFTWVISPTKHLFALWALSPQHLVVPAAALCYLYHEAKILTNDEVKTFVIVAVSVKNFSVQQLSNLHVPIPTERAIYLATLFVRTVLHVLDAAGACGLSLPRLADCHLDAYFDGKLFHYIYRKSQHNTDPRFVIAWDTSREMSFNSLMNIIE